MIFGKKIVRSKFGFGSFYRLYVILIGVSALVYPVTQQMDVAVMVWIAVVGIFILEGHLLALAKLNKSFGYVTACVLLLSIVVPVFLVNFEMGGGGIGSAVSFSVLLIVLLIIGLFLAGPHNRKSK